MDEFDQRSVDKAHGALGMARRVVAELELSIERFDERLREIVTQAEQLEAARQEQLDALAAAQAELTVRESDPLLTFSSSKGEIFAINAESAEGTGGIN